MFNLIEMIEILIVSIQYFLRIKKSIVNISCKIMVLIQRLVMQIEDLLGVRLICLID